MLNITGNLLPALNVLNGLPVVLDLALGLGEDLLQLVHLALQLGLKGELHVVECEGARGQLIPGESNLIDGKGIGKASKKNQFFLGNSPKHRTPSTHPYGLGLI